MDQHTLDALDFERIRTLLAGFALTGLGRELAARIEPVTRASLVQRWYTQIEELRTHSEAHGQPPFGGLSDVRELVRRCAPPLRVTVEDVARIGDALAATHELARYLSTLPDSAAELRHLADRIGDFQILSERIRETIDERGRMRDHASRKLARIRGEIESATEHTHAMLDKLLHESETRKLLQYPNYTFYNDRLVLPVRSEYRGRIPGIVHRTSDSGATIYVEPAAVVEFNNQISNLRNEETEEINRILWELAHEIYLNAESVVGTLDALAILDLITAKLRLAKEYSFRCPEVVDEPVLSVRKARHPVLIDLFRREAAEGKPRREVVPIDYRLGDDFQMLIITGPNTGGKTVTLKTVGLLTLMVQSGVPVPVDEGSKFGVFKRVLIDIGDEQSMQQSLSTFSAHLRRLMEMLQRAGAGVLALIDELGAGTDPDEGAAIGQAILEELLAKECCCIATTHLGALKAFPLAHAGAENGCVDFDEESLQPTYHLSIGTPGSSNAIMIAQRLGMSKRLIGVARQNVSQQAQKLTKALRGTVSAKRDAEKARAAAEDARIDADRAQSELDKARADLADKHRAFDAWLQSVVHLQPGDGVHIRGFRQEAKVSRVRLDQQRIEVDLGSFAAEVPLGDVLPPGVTAPPARQARERKATPGSSDTTGKQRRAKGKAAKQRAQAEQSHASASGAGSAGDASRSKPDDSPPLTAEQIERLAVGDVVFVRTLRRRGKLLRIERERNAAVVGVGVMEVEVPFDGLAEARVQKPKRKRPRRRKQDAARSANPNPAETQPTPEQDVRADVSALDSARVASEEPPERTPQPDPPAE